MEDIFPSAKKMAEYFMEELAKKDRQIEELKFALIESRIGGSDSQVWEVFYLKAPSRSTLRNQIQ